MTKMQKKIYDHDWYLRNRSYKKTYARLHYRAVNHNSEFYNGVVDALIVDRQSQKRKGLWIDEI